MYSVKSNGNPGVSKDAFFSLLLAIIGQKSAAYLCPRKKLFSPDYWLQQLLQGWVGYLITAHHPEYSFSFAFSPFTLLPCHIPDTWKKIDHDTTFYFCDGLGRLGEGGLGWLDLLLKSGHCALSHPRLHPQTVERHLDIVIIYLCPSIWYFMLCNAYI